VRSYRRYWKLLNQESEWRNRIYAESKDVNLMLHTKREARTWLVGAHTDMEHARDHIGKPIREIEEYDAGRSRGEEPECEGKRGQPPDDQTAADQLSDEQIQPALLRVCSKSHINYSQLRQLPDKI
jgi:hypothetical protein